MTNLKPNKYYYIKHKYPERTIDRKLEKGWAGSCSYDVAEVLCDVPTYEEYCIERKMIMDLSEENAQLKELLKECQHILKEQNFYRNTPIETDTAYRTRCLKKQELLTKIDEALR